MSVIEALLAKPIFQALGWTLVHFLWQGAVVAVLYQIAKALMRRRGANARYLVACIALALMLTLPIFTLFIMSRSSARSSDEFSPNAAATLVETSPVAALTPDAQSEPATMNASHSASESSASNQSISITQWAQERFAPVLPWLVALWFAGVLFFSLRFLGGLFMVRRLKRHTSSPVLQQWQEKLSGLAKQIRVSRPVRLCESVLVEVPTVIGWLRPVILVPASAITGLSPEQLEALLAHELAHIRRYDYLINLLQAAVEALLFYHPAVWWVSGQIRKEREHCCDDLAVAACGNVLVYARALADLEQLRTATPQLAVAASGGSLIERIQRLIGSPARSSHRFESGLAGVIAIAASLCIFAGAQNSLSYRYALTAEANDSSTLASPESLAAQSSDKLQLDQVGNQKSFDKPESEALQSEPDRTKQTATAPGERAIESEVEPSFDHQQNDGSTGPQDFIGSMAALGYTNLSADDLIALKMHGVTPNFVREINALSNRKLSVDQLTAFRIHGVTSEFISELKGLGYDNLSANRLTAFRVHGVTPQYISEWKSAGYDNLPPDSLIAFRIHGVTTALVQTMKDLGFDRLTPDELTSLRIHGVSPVFIQTMRAFIRGELSIGDLTGLRIHGVTVEFIKEIEMLGYDSLSADQLKSMRIHRVTPGFIQAIQSLGYKPTVDQLTSLRMHRVTPDFIEAVKSRGFNDVTIAQLIELRRLNIIPGSRNK